MELGRKPELKLTHPRISRTHATLQWRPADDGSAAVQCLAHKRVDVQRAGSSSTTAVEPGEQVHHGKWRFEIEEAGRVVGGARVDRDEATGRLATIGKAYSGLTDKEIATMTEWFEAHTIRRTGRYHVVEPTVVVEIAFDVIHRSNRHDSGFALRFPRIFQIGRAHV